MNSFFPRSASALAVAAAVVGLTIFGVSPAVAASRPQSIDVRIVAEQTDEGAALPPVTRERPALYAAYDAGLVEAGDSMAGDRPPSAALVRETLDAALEARGYQAASGEPSVVLVYHWGVIRPVSYRPPTAFKLDPNLKARLALVAPARTAVSVENYLLGRKYSSEINRHFPTPAFLGPDLQNALQLADDNLYFVAVSAYDRAATARGDKTLWWRLKATARDVSGPMNEVIPALLRAASPYFGNHYDEALTLTTPLDGAIQAAPSVGERDRSAAVDPPSALLQKIMKDEHAAFAGEFGASLDEKPRTTKGPGRTTSELPPALAQRVASYTAEKAALQTALAAQIKGLSPGAETRNAIDAFNTQHAIRIAALAQTREAIRSELAQLANTSLAAGDKSLDALRREFAAGVENLETPRPPIPE